MLKCTAILFMWIAIAVIGAAVYGLINDQITVTISPEYYSVFKHHQFAPVLKHIHMIDAPLRLQAAVIGMLATWWYGLYLGIMLGISSMVGRYAPLSTRLYIKAILWIMATILVASAITGGIAYMVEPRINPHASFLAGITDSRSAFAVGWWHNAAYLVALISTVVASFWAQWMRMRNR